MTYANFERFFLPIYLRISKFLCTFAAAKVVPNNRPFNLSMKRYLFLLTFTCALCVFAHTSEKQSEKQVAEKPLPVVIDPNLYFNQDSLEYYRKLAYLEEDPRGMYIMAVVSHISHFDYWPDSVFCTVPREDGDIMLWRAAQLGYAPAQDLIRCLDFNGCWNHSVPFSDK